jgi:hypothetical protein
VALVVMLVPTSEQQMRENAPRPALNSQVGWLARRKKTESLRQTIGRGSFLSASDPNLDVGCVWRSGFWANDRAQKARTTRL